MKAWIALLSLLLVAGCATTPPPPRPEGVFGDHLFRAPAARISAAEVFAVSGEMRAYVDAEIAPQVRTKGRQQALVDALYRKSGLRLEYDSAATRNAAQAFEARAGNCLSLVIMTAAFAKELGLPVEYQRVLVEDTWSRSGDIYLVAGHVNLTLGRRIADGGVWRRDGDLLTIDFLPPRELRGLRTQGLAEATVVAMYMNNRAVEALAQGQLDDAYWWAREAIVQDPGFLSAYNTLGAVYQRRGHAQEAERVFAQVLARDPRNTQVMSNLVVALDDLGRTDEARALSRRLAELDPVPPFSYFNRGRAAMTAGDVRTARELFAKEVARAPYYHEFHYWLAVAEAALGEVESARVHLALAMENSTTRGDHDLYAAKLERIKSGR